VSLTVAVPTRISGGTLPAQNFGVLTGDEPRPIVVRPLGADSLDVVILIDDRASIGGDVLHAELAAAAELLVGLDPGTNVAIVAFTQATPLQPRTANVASALSSLREPLGRPSATQSGDDGLAAAAAQFRPGTGVRRALVEFIGADASASSGASATVGNLPAGTAVYTLGPPQAPSSGAATVSGDARTGALIRDVDGVLSELTGQYQIEVGLSGAPFPPNLTLRVQLSPSHVVTVAVPLTQPSATGSDSGARGGQAQAPATSGERAPSGPVAAPPLSHPSDTTKEVLRALVACLLALLAIATAVELTARRHRRRLAVSPPDASDKPAARATRTDSDDDPQPERTR